MTPLFSVEARRKAVVMPQLDLGGRESRPVWASM